MRSRVDGMWWGTAIEAPDPGALARFYSQLLDWPIGHEEPGTAIVAAPQGSIYLVFQHAGDYRAPVWPPVDLGATPAAERPRENVRVMLDPAGHPFCLRRDDG